MFFIYSALLTAAYLILSPRFLFDVLRNGKYAAGFWQRMGHLPEFDSENKPVIWLHCVSVGETRAAGPLVDELLKECPGHKLVVSTTTGTGQQVARQMFGEKAALIFYFPLDWKFTVHRALKKIGPKTVLIMETELWFRFLREAHKSGVKIAIVNGRLSERSVNRYLYIRNFMRRVLNYIDLALMQNQADAGRIREIGMKNARIRVTGNIKFDQAAGGGETALTKEFRARFAIAPSAPLIIAASTHDPEEKLLLEAFAKLRKTHDAARLMLVPRHPERFDQIARLVNNFGFGLMRRSAPPSAGDHKADVILLDSIGELHAAFPLGEIVFVGGSLIPHGGQNILEPAAARRAIVTGPHTANFAAIVKEFVEKEAVIQLPQIPDAGIPGQLTDAFAELLSNTARREKLAENARALIKQNSGAAAKTVEYLKTIL